MKRITQSFTRVALGATFLFATMLMAIPTTALNCKNLNVIYMRGSSQNYTPIDGSDVNFPKWKLINNAVEFDDPRTEQERKDKVPAFVYTERESMKYFKNIGDRVHADFPGLTMQFVSLHDIAGKYNSNGYKAVSAFGSKQTAYISKNAIDAKFGNFSIVQDITGDLYNQSVNDGAEELAGYLQDQMTSCPSQYNVVGGFSQGAHVVGEAMKKMHDRGQDNLLSRLGHVDMYGDPKFNGFDLQTSRLNPLQKHVTMPWTRGNANQQSTGSLGPRQPYVPDILTSKTTSWCDQNDVVCGGLAGVGINYDAHGEVYNTAGGWTDKSANEIYVDLKPRLALLAGLKDQSANSPLAYWDGIKNPKKLDVMFVMDRTGDENLSLSPEADYLSRNFAYLADSKITSISAGLVTYTEYSSYNGTKDVIQSFPKTITNLTLDVYGDYSYFKSTWGPAHSQNPPHGGEDLQDSPYSAINLALSQKDWRPEARKVIVLFSNTWGKDIEEDTGLTMKTITANARAKNVEILPVFTSKTFRATQEKADLIPTANAFWNKLAKDTGGHYTEVSDLIYGKLVYDVIMGHVHSPDVEITTAKAYNTPKAKAATKGKTAPTTIKNTKLVVKKGKKVALSAVKSNAPKGKVVKYQWDTNGDGAVDETSELPDITFTPGDEFDGTVTVVITDQSGNTTTGQQDVQATDDDDQITHEDPQQLPTPVITASRNGTDVILTWVPTAGDMVFKNPDGSLLAVANAAAGTFTVRDAPSDAFSLGAQLVDGNDYSDTVQISIAAAPTNVVPTSITDQPTDTTNPTTGGTGSPLPQQTTTPQGSQPANTGAQTTNPQLVITAGTGQVLGIVSQPTNKPAESQQIYKTTYGQKAPLFSFAKIKAAYNPGGIMAGLRFVFWATFYSFWPDMTMLLILLLLLLIMLDISLRDHRKQQYKHSQQYAYKPLLQNTYKA